MSGKVVPLTDSFPDRKPDQVTTFDPLSTSTIGYRSNPDTLVGRHGLTIYSRMANDEQVKAVLNFKRDAITARGWQFQFRKSSKLAAGEQDKRRELFDEVVARMRGSFSDALNAIMTGRAYGFSITEKVYGELEHDGKTWPAINMLLGRDPLSFRFYTNAYGVLEKIEQHAHYAGIVEVDPRRVIHYVHAPEWDHVYGRSDLREAYKSWYIKDQVTNLWPMYLERFGGGFLVTEIAPETNLTASDLDKLDEALKRAKSLGAIRPPPGVKIAVHMPAPTDGYEKAIQHNDLAIAKALLVPNLLGISQSSGGSYAQSQTQLEAFFWTLNADATRLEECLNEQLFRDLGDQCWGDGDYPEFRFKPASIEHMKWVVNTWAALIGAGAVIATEDDEAFIREMLDIPARDPKAKTIATAAMELNPVAPTPGLPGEKGTDEEGDDEEGDDEDKAEDDKPVPVGKGALKEFIRAAIREAFEYNPGQPRADDGKWTDGGGSSGGGDSGGKGNPAGKRIVDKVLAGDSYNKTFKPKTVEEQNAARTEHQAAIAAVHSELTSRGYSVDERSQPKGFVHRLYGKDNHRVQVQGGWRNVAPSAGSSSRSNSRVEYTLRVIALSPTSMSRRSFVTFTTAEERDAWIDGLRPRDEIVLGAALVFDEADDPPTDPHVELEVILDEPRLELPLHAAMAVERVVNHRPNPQRVVVRYAGLTR